MPLTDTGLVLRSRLSGSDSRLLLVDGQTGSYRQLTLSGDSAQNPSQATLSVRSLAKDRDAVHTHAHRRRSSHRHHPVLQDQEVALELYDRFRLNQDGRSLGVEIG